MRVVFFAPEDLEIIGGSPAERRRFLDMGLSQVEPEMIALLLQYDRAVKQRNNLLRRSLSRPDRSVESRELDVWDEQCAKLGAKVIGKRYRTLQEIGPLLNAAYERLAGHGLAVEYVGEVWDPDERECEKLLGAHLVAKRETDRQKGATSVGPHRDDLRFRVEDKVLRSFGSQGERRTAALALRLAELEFQRLKTGLSPILLIDDVIYEMDPARRGRFLESLHREGQILFTATDLAALGPLAESARVFRVEGGHITEAARV
jgi:DNA replication and repair protein RecF